MVLQKKKYRERLDYMKENEDAAVKVYALIKGDSKIITGLEKSFWFIFLLYPTQRVAEGIMFLTRPSVSQSVSQSVRQSCISC